MEKWYSPALSAMGPKGRARPVDLTGKEPCLSLSLRLPAALEPEQHLRPS